MICYGAGFQYWMLSKAGEIRRDETCLDYAGQEVILYPCHGSKGNQYWHYNPDVSVVLQQFTGHCTVCHKANTVFLPEVFMAFIRCLILAFWVYSHVVCCSCSVVITQLQSPSLGCMSQNEVMAQYVDLATYPSHCIPTFC